VVLANSEYKHELESDIDPFKGLLLGLFFISVGASIDFPLILSQPGLIIGIVLGLMLIKGMVLFILGKIFGLKTDQNMLFAFALSQVGEFAFVLFSFSAKEGILAQSTIDIMMAAVATSMALTPLVILLNEKWILPKVSTKSEEQVKPADTIHEENEVIIAGFGHFGNTVGRFLRAHNIHTTVLDNNPEWVDILRRMGFKVYYGDASRHDLLEKAGAAKAKLIIIAIDEPEKRLEIIETVKKHFPNLRMLVRAKNRTDAYDQMNAGMLHVYRETLDTAVKVGVETMKFLGYRTYSAQRAGRSFIKLDEANLKKLSSIRNQDEYIIAAKAHIEELEKVLKTDNLSFINNLDKGWDEESLIAEITEKLDKSNDGRLI
jgi:hypothetical protein